MSAEKLSKKLGDLGKAIDLCYEHHLNEPTLILIYAAIDICGWLANDDPMAGVGKRFVAWAKRYTDPEKKLRCTADDLYGARCGLVHTLSPDSDANKKGKARQVGYAWGRGQVDRINKIYKKAGMSKLVVMIHVNHLRKSWSEGVARFKEHLVNDEKYATRVYERSAQFFADYAASKEGKIKALSVSRKQPPKSRTRVPSENP